MLLTCDRIDILSTITSEIGNRLMLLSLNIVNGQVEGINNTIAPPIIWYYIVVHALCIIRKYLIIYDPSISLSQVDSHIFCRFVFYLSRYN